MACPLARSRAFDLLIKDRGCEPTIRGTGAAEIVFGTPRMVLGRGGFFKADDSRKHSNRSAKNQL
jgi:hypothetical protein